MGDAQLDIHFLVSALPRPRALIDDTHIVEVAAFIVVVELGINILFALRMKKFIL